jgi:NADPH2:quinone reductase
MLAARVHAFESDLLVEEVPEPVPAAGESLVEILAANVQRLDLDLLAGAFPIRPRLPYVPGVSGSGRLLESSALRAGELVHIEGADVGMGRDGTWAQRAALPDTALSVVPADLDPVRYAAFCDSFVTAYLAVVDVGEMASGERVLVTGAAGNVGSLAVQLALDRSARAVIGAVRRDERRPLVPAGATAVVGVEEAAAALDGPADLLVDTVGGEQLQNFVDLVAPGGRACLVGYTAGTTPTLDLPRLLLADVRLLPVNAMRWRGRSTAAPVAELRRGRFEARFETQALRRVNDALERLRAGLVEGRVVLTPNRDDDRGAGTID